MIGINSKESFIVREKDLAINVGSGSLPVFGTPAMVSYMEGAAMRLVHPKLQRGQGTVGAAINVKHLKPSILGETLVVNVEIISVDDRKITFQLSVINKAGVEVGLATHERFIIDEEKFMQKLT